MNESKIAGILFVSKIKARTLLNFWEKEVSYEQKITSNKNT